MSDFLTWDGISGLVGRDGERETLPDKPNALGFTFDTLYYEPDAENYFKVVNNKKIALTAEERQTCIDYIGSFKFSQPHTHVVDENGVYQGVGAPEGYFATVPYGPDDDGNYIWNFDTQQWDWIIGVDEQGNYLGNRPFYELHMLVESEPPADYYIWDFTSSAWVDSRTLEEIQAQGIVDIDRVAGEIRSKFITVAPGQEGTYLRKADQARKWVAEKIAGNAPDIEDVAYVLVKSEMLTMQAVDETVTADLAAQVIVEKEDQWLTLAAAIETYRRVGKEKLAQATTATEAKAILNETIANLKLVGAT